MRVRHALAGLAAGCLLALGGTAATAQAAGPAGSAKGSADGANTAAAEWHFHSGYSTWQGCEAAGPATGLPYKCMAAMPTPTGIWTSLYVWY